jgi:ribosomal protein S18 acetylase RimI-like enzyme
MDIFMSSAVTIRRAVAADAAELAKLARQTFVETYAQDNLAENMDQHCVKYFGVEQQLAEINNPDYAVLLAFVNQELAGFAQVVRRDPPECVTHEHAIALFRYYVLKKWHGQGIAKVLFNRVIDAVKEFNGQHVWLTVWENNARAISFYQKINFRQVGFADYPFGTEVQTDFVLLKSL